MDPISWLLSVATTICLAGAASLLALAVGGTTALLSWSSGLKYAAIPPVLMLGVPPWLFAYVLSDLLPIGFVHPFMQAVLCLGVCCAVYPHVLISAGLADRASKDLETLSVFQGMSFSSILKAVKPVIVSAVIPSACIVGAETMADFGVVNFYGINTLTGVSYNVWTSTWNLWSVVPGIVLLALLGFLTASASQATNTPPLTTSRVFAFKPSILRASLASVPTLSLIFICFIHLFSVFDPSSFYPQDLMVQLFDTFTLTTFVLLLSVLASVVYLIFPTKFYARLGVWLYAFPGTVVGAIFLLLGQFVPLMVLLILAVATRYFGLLVSSIAAALSGAQKYTEVFDVYETSTIKKLKHKAIMVRPAILLGVGIIALDVIRELPISMILQPMNFQTIAMSVSYHARTESLASLAPGSLAVLVIGLFLAIAIILIQVKNAPKS